MKEPQHQPGLTSSEMAALWTQYAYNTAQKCFLIHFLATVNDEDIHVFLVYAIKIIENQTGIIIKFFNSENFPIPIAFDDKDVNEKSTPLFSDSFILYYLKYTTVISMTANSLSISSVTRMDVSKFFLEVMSSATDLHDRIRKIMLSKGIYIRPPYITTPNKVDFIQKQNFLTGFLGKKRPLTAIEISHIFHNLQSNMVSKTMMMAFAQTAYPKEIDHYFQRGKEIAKKHIDIFSEFLMKEDIPAPIPWDLHINDSKIPPLSDKLMMFLVTLISASGVGNYGLAMAASQRRDLGVIYTRLLGEVAIYAEDGANIAINNGWMEEPPHATDNNTNYALK
jgi:hypothetical protein